MSTATPTTDATEFAPAEEGRGWATYAANLATTGADRAGWHAEAFTCHLPNLGKLIGKHAALCRKAEKLGFLPPIFDFFHLPHAEPVRRPDPETGEWATVYYPAVWCYVAAPPLLGLEEGKPDARPWDAIGALAHTEASPLVNLAPGLGDDRELLAAVRLTAPGDCDHCGLERRRAEHIILRRELPAGVARHASYRSYWDGLRGWEVAAVGKSCLLDFVGIDPGYALLLAAWREDAGPPPAAAADLVPVTEYLAWVARQARIDGAFVTSGQANHHQEATWRRAIEALEAWERGTNIGLSFPPTADDREEARAAIVYFAAQDPSEAQSAYLHNLIRALRCGAVPRRGYALVASALTVYRRAKLAREASAREAADRPVSAWQGAIGERRRFAGLRCKTMIPRVNAWGTTHIYKLEDAAGNQFTWFSSRNVLEPGNTYDLDATVKQHDEWRGTRQTIIGGCRVLAEHEGK